MEENCSCNGTTEGSVFQKVAYIPVFTVGLLLNGLAVYIFIRRRSSWTDTHVYTFSLAVANCILLLFLPIRTYNAFHHLRHDDFCLFLVAMHYINMYVSIFTRTAISVHRCVAVNFPMRRRAWGSQKLVATVVCILIWVMSVSLSIIFNLHHDDKSLDCCYERKWQPLKPELFQILVIVGFFIPLGVIIICTVLTVRLLRCGRGTGIIGIMTVNLVVFTLCYTPIHAGFFLKFWAASCSPFIYRFYHVSEWMATTNCCWDVVAYYFLFKTFFASRNKQSSTSSAITAITASRANTCM